jgi:hypothetical protein
MKLNPEHNPLGYFFYKALRFLVLLVVLDQGLGWVLNQLYFSQDSGKYYRMTHSLMETEADVLLVGTSHTVRHFVPEVFADSLDQTVYNIGARGQNLYYCAALVDAILDRHQPQRLIVNIDPDMFLMPENYDKLSDLKPYYWKEKGIRPHVEKRGFWEKVKLTSRLYTYNSTLIHLVRYLAVPQKDYDGYLPLEGQSKVKFTESDQKLDAPDFAATEDQLALLEDMVKEAKDKGSEVIFVISPILAGDYIHNAAIEEMARAHDVPLFNYSLDKRFVQKNELFGDVSHLNHEGAVLLSSDLSHQIKNLHSPKLAQNHNE